MTQDQQQKKAAGRDPNREHMTLSELWQLWRDNLMSWRSFCDEHHDLFTLNIQAGFRRIGRWLSDLHSNARALAAANRDRRFPESEYGAAQLFLFFRGSLERRAAAIREGFSNRRKALTWMGGKRRHFFEKMHLHPVAFLCGAMAIAAAATVLSLYTLGAQLTYAAPPKRWWRSWRMSPARPPATAATPWIRRCSPPKQAFSPAAS